MAGSYEYTFEDEKAFRALSWTWAKAVDTKDWVLLESICTENVQMLYSDLSPQVGDSTRSRDEYVNNFIKPFLGDVNLDTQHMLGAVVFSSQSRDKATGSWQGCARHIRKLENGSVAEWSAGTYIDHFYERVDGKWRFAGLRPHTRLWETGKADDVFENFN